MPSSILASIERDLAAFADPGSPVLVDEAEALWEQGGREMRVRFLGGPGEYPDIEYEGSKMSFRTFLASHHMADLGHLADFTLRTGIFSGPYIETDAQLAEETADDLSQHETYRRSALQLLREQSTENLPYLSTQVVFVRGEAGAGKTVVLRKLTDQQARLFPTAPSVPLFFYINVQGRALSRLEDVISKELDDLRARFPYHAIEPLTRHGLIVPIIDGFDELLGSGGYDEAFSSLASLLAKLEGRGSIIASARSAFFEYRDFRRNAERFSSAGSLNYKTVTVEILPWSLEKIREYFRVSQGPNGNEAAMAELQFSELYESLDVQNQRLLQKPFYTSKVAELVKHGVELHGSEALLEQLVAAFLEREVRKLTDGEGGALLPLQGHREFLTALAEEMWWQEGLRLDVSTVQVVAELVAEKYRLAPATARALVEKVSSYAFLSSRVGDRRYLAFEHEVFYGYFLAEKLSDLLVEGGSDLRRFLSRAILEPLLVEQAVRRTARDTNTASQAARVTCAVLKPVLAEVVARENAGTLVAALTRAVGGLEPQIQLANLVFRGVSFSGVRLEEPRFEGCDFDDVDLSDCIFLNPVFRRTTLRTVKVDLNTTRLDGAVLKPGEEVLGISAREDDEMQGPFYAPAKVAALLRRVGAAVPGFDDAEVQQAPAVKRRLALLDRLLKRAERQFYLDREGTLFQDVEWENVETLLRKFDLLEDKVIQRSGPPQPLLRLTAPPGLIRRGENVSDPSVPSNVRQFWRELVV